jgi:hypothetical protein
MRCQELSLAGGTFRIEVDRGSELPPFTARIWRLDAATGRAHPLEFADGRRAEVHATSEPLALNSAIAYLQNEFGAPGEPDHGCLGPRREGDPEIVPSPGAGPFTPS